jgi:hypothetical protein
MRAGLVVVAVAVFLATGMGTAAAGETHTFEFRPVVAEVPTTVSTGSNGACDGCRVLPSQSRLTSSDRLLVGRSRVDHRDLTHVSYRLQADPGVVLTLTPKALKRFNQLAAASYRLPSPRNELAVVVDGVIVTTPMFTGGTFDGPIQISGGFSREDTKRLAAKIKSACDC